MTECSKCHQECDRCVTAPDGTQQCGLCNAISRAERHYELSAILNYLRGAEKPTEEPKKLFENILEKRGPGRPKKS